MGDVLAAIMRCRSGALPTHQFVPQIARSLASTHLKHSSKSVSGLAKRPEALLTLGDTPIVSSTRQVYHLLGYRSRGGVYLGL